MGMVEGGREVGLCTEVGPVAEEAAVLWVRLEGKAKRRIQERMTRTTMMEGCTMEEA